ncbi:hypothetical protein [Streptomyces sp. AcH 505]
MESHGNPSAYQGRGEIQMYIGIGTVVVILIIVVIILLLRRR